MHRSFQFNMNTKQEVQFSYKDLVMCDFFEVITIWFKYNDLYCVIHSSYLRHLQFSKVAIVSVEIKPK